MLIFQVLKKKWNLLIFQRVRLCRSDVWRRWRRDIGGVGARDKLSNVDGVVSEELRIGHFMGEHKT